MKPIIFNTEMVKAILDGRKTQFRKIAKLDNIDCPNCEDYLVPYGWVNDKEVGYQCIDEDCMYITSIKQKPKYKVDDILYVKETYSDKIKTSGDITYKADWKYGDGRVEIYDTPIKWKPSIHLKQKDARLFLKVINVRVERLQDMDWKDIFNEGFEAIKPIEQYQSISLRKECKNWWINLWNSTAKDGYKYEDNPPVFVYEFVRVKSGEVK